MTETGEVAGMVIGLVMACIVLGSILTNMNTDAILGATTSSVTPLTTLGWVALTIAAIGIIAVVGKFIIGVFS